MRWANAKRSAVLNVALVKTTKKKPTFAEKKKLKTVVNRLTPISLSASHT